MSNKSYPEDFANELTIEECSDETKAPIDQEGFSHKTASQADNKLRIFFEKIYSTVEVDSNFNSNLKENGIHYHSYLIIIIVILLSLSLFHRHSLWRSIQKLQSSHL